MVTSPAPPRPARTSNPLPLGLLGRYRPLLGPDWHAFLDALEAPLPSCVWTNTLRISPQELEALLEADGMEPSPLPWEPRAFRLAPRAGLGNRWWYLAGLCHSQEEVSLLPVVLLDPQPGERVLDLCAAPGGKSAQAAVAMRNRGTLVANDVLIQRMRALKANVERLGLINVSTTLADGSKYPRAAGGYDRVLVDVPCSCEGTLRKNRVLAGAMGEEGSRRRARQQLALLRRALALCRPGGRVVYSTCTFAPEENELVVQAALEAGGERTALLPARVPGFRVRPGVTHWQGRALDSRLALCARVWPQDNDTGGFFVAVIEKAAQQGGRPEAGAPVTPVAAPELEEVLALRFGVPGGVLADWRVHRRSSRGLHLCNRDHEPPPAPSPEAMGLLVVGTKLKPPKLTTGGAVLAGAHATRNVVDLGPPQVGPYLMREELALAGQQVRLCTGDGYVIVRYRGLGLGVGRVRLATRRLQSLYPKRWGGVAIERRP